MTTCFVVVGEVNTSCADWNSNWVSKAFTTNEKAADYCDLCNKDPVANDHDLPEDVFNFHLKQVYYTVTEVILD